MGGRERGKGEKGEERRKRGKRERERREGRREKGEGETRPQRYRPRVREREKETLATLLLIPRWSREQVFSVCVRARVKVFVLPLCISVFECEHVGMHMYLWVLLCV